MQFFSRMQAEAQADHERCQSCKGLIILSSPEVAIGAVVWMVKHGCKIPVDVLKSSINELRTELRSDGGWGYCDPKARAKAVKEEIKLLRRCEQAGGQIDPIETIPSSDDRGPPPHLIPKPSSKPTDVIDLTAEDTAVAPPAPKKIRIENPTGGASRDDPIVIS